MVIDESKINEMIQKEIKSQVENKLKQIGRQALLNTYKEVMEKQVSQFLIEQQKETVNQLNVQIEIEKDYWKKEVLDSIKDKFSQRLDHLFDSGDQNWY